MAVNRIPWGTAARGDRLELCVLVAGYPHPIVPAGVTLTAVAWTGDPDPAWHPGTSGFTSKPWLAVPTGRPDDPPHLVVSEKLSPVQGTIDVEPLQLSLDDPRGAVTELIASRDAMPATPIRATLTAASPGPLDVVSTEGFPSSGVVYLGREVIAYSGKTATSFTGLTRARYGTVAQDHRFVSSQIRPSVFGDVPGATTLPGLLGRRVTVWLLRFTGATTATDPSLMFDGRAGAGASLRGAGWAIPVEHAIASLSQELRAVPLTFSGYHHQTTAARGFTAQEPDHAGHPLWLRWNGRNALLTGRAGDPDADGWHATPGAFVDAFRRGLLDAGLGSDVSLAVGADGSVSIGATNGGPSQLLVYAGWPAPDGNFYASAEDTAAAHRTPPMPAAYVPLQGTVRLTAREAGQVPTLPSGLPADMQARYAAVVGEGDDLQAVTIEEVYASPPGLRVLPLRGQRVVLFEPTGATVGIAVSYSNWWQAWELGVLPLWDNVQGLNGAADSFDWPRVRAVASRAAAAAAFIPRPRDYLLAPGDELAAVLANELRLTGLCLTTWRGRIACVRAVEVAATEPLAAQIPKRDLLDGDPAVTEVADGLATVFSFTVPGQGTVRAVDVAAEAEHGAGDAIECDAGAVRLDGFSIDAEWERIAQAGMTVLGPHRHPYRVATVRLPAAYAGVELGQTVTLDDWLLPTGEGARGLSSVPCVVVGRRLHLTEAFVELDLRLSASGLTGYAPEALVSAVSGAALTIDTSYLGSDQGPHGFADDLLADDASARADGGTSTFTAGDEVQLVELDTATPAAPFRATVLSASSTTVTLDASPGATWATLAATPGKVLLAFAPYADATTAQRRYCYLADASDHLIDGNTRARRYAP